MLEVRGEVHMPVSSFTELNEALVDEGDYLYTPPGFRHSVTSKTGCVLFFVIPEEVELLPGSGE